MKENYIDISTSLIKNSQIIQDDRIKKTQENLIMMGFDIEMVNKIISTFKIRTEEEVLNYLIKNENGMWEHPFIPKVEEEEEDKKSIISSLSIRSKKDGNKIKLFEDIYEICGESKDIHLIKEFNSNNSNNNFNFPNSDDNDINIITNNNIIIKDDDAEQEEDKEIDDIDQKECEICMNDLENPIKIISCKHQFCQDCFHSYLINLIKNNQIDQIPCPKNKCKNKNIPEKFFSKYLSEEEYFKYCDFKSKNEIARDATKIFCPLCNSYADIDKDLIDLFDSNNPNYIKSTLKCKKGHEFCSCGRPTHEGNCYKDEKEFKKFIKKEKIKSCPNCGFLIKKHRGCNHMICGNPTCRYEFCWLCMKEARPDHYENTPCAGKQFLDTENMNKFELSHPCLSKLFICFICLLDIIFLAIPFFFISGYFLDMFYSRPRTYCGIDKLKSSIKFFIFLTDVLLSIAIQSLGYIVEGIFVMLLFLFCLICILLFILDIIKILIELPFCCCLDYEIQYLFLTNNFTSWVCDRYNIFCDDLFNY